VTFRIIVIPDTQYLVATTSPAEWNAHYYAMADWIVAHKTDLNIQAVLHVGDLVHNNTRGEWEVASDALNRIKSAGIPFIPCRGNHDGQALYNEFFGYAALQAFSYVGKYSETDACNYSAELEIAGEPYLFISIDFGPTDAVMAWVSNEIQNHPDHHIMIVTHSYLYIDGTRVSPGDEHNPKSYLGDSVNDGEDMWQDYLKQHPNVECIFSGHHLGGNFSQRVDLNEGGRTVYQSFQNWQHNVQGGNGRVCVYGITPRNLPNDRADLTVQVYDPVLGQYLPEYETASAYGNVPKIRPIRHIYTRAVSGWREVKGLNQNQAIFARM